MALYNAHDFGDLSEEFWLDSYAHLFVNVHDFNASPAPPAPAGVTVTYTNKVWDPGGGGNWVPWDSTPLPDPAGATYPDPYGSGYGACSGHRATVRWA